LRTMAEIIEMRVHRDTRARAYDGAERASSVAGNEREKASLRLVASLMAFGPTATTKQFDAIARRGGRRTMRATH